jgi:hypothetical protein
MIVLFIVDWIYARPCGEASLRFRRVAFFLAGAFAVADLVAIGYRFFIEIIIS